MAVPGWETLPVTVAAQTVQRSAFPDAYAKWEGLADAAGVAARPASPTRSARAAPAVLAKGVAGRRSAFALGRGRQALRVGRDRARPPTTAPG